MKKFRHEFKYLIDEMILKNCYERLCSICKVDKNVGAAGYYNVRSLYFDDFEDTFLTENENGIDNRYKWRIRIYDCAESFISLERKSKVHGMTLKESTQISKELVLRLINCETISVRGIDCLLDKFLIEGQMRIFIPAVIVDYDRIPFIFEHGNVRITIDRNISASKDYESFFAGNLLSRPILDTGYHVLEIKYDEYLPSFLKRILNVGKLERISFSKYYLCRRSME